MPTSDSNTCFTVLPTGKASHASKTFTTSEIWNRDGQGLTSAGVKIASCWGDGTRIEVTKQSSGDTVRCRGVGVSR